jgi:alkylation response protein AidB-like acyl-CoA dehydrogenase
VPAENLVGRAGFGLSHVAASALDYGRYSVAWGCVGLLRACLEASVRHAHERRQFGSLLKDHQLIRRMLTDMMTDARAARLLCLRAGNLKDAGDPSASVETLVAKYFAARAAMRAAGDAVQIHGAVGCSAESPVSRYFRDAKVMEIIEGSNEIQQLTIADYAHLGL